jgi:hypothetical protein
VMMQSGAVQRQPGTASGSREVVPGRHRKGQGLSASPIRRCIASW